MAKEKDKTEVITQIDLSEENLAKINDWQLQGWKIEQREDGWYGEKQFESDDEKDNKPVVYNGVDSLEALFGIIESEEQMFVDWKAEQTEDSKPLPETEKAEDEPEKPKYVFENCRVQLTREDIRNRTSEYMQTLNTLDDKERVFSSVKEQHKSTVKGLNATAQRLRLAITSEYDWRDVECREEFNYSKGLVDIFRVDTEEKVRTRTMTDKERQLSFV